MSMDGELVRIVENPRGWFGPTLVGKGGRAKINEEATTEHIKFYNVTNTESVPPHILFHESRLEVI